MTTPRDWQRALSEFLAAFPQRRDVIAAVACGSFITGSPSPRSDIDVHLILKDDIGWRERGNKIVRGILIEYFANPPAQIREYFHGDHKDNRQATATQFVTGRIIFDEKGKAAALQAEARRWLRKKLPARKAWRHELDKYAIWDHHDNLTDAYEQRATNFEYLYFNWLTMVYDLYARHFRQAVANEKNTLAILTSARVRKKYCASKFPDARFVGLFEKAIGVRGRATQLRAADALRKHVLKHMGGFEIDGWKMRTPLSVKNS